MHGIVVSRLTRKIQLQSGSEGVVLARVALQM